MLGNEHTCMLECMTEQVSIDICKEVFFGFLLVKEVDPLYSVTSTWPVTRRS